MYFDHVAFATRDANGPIATLVGELGGTVLSGGDAIGFRSMQVFLGDEDGGMKVEMLEPWAVDQSDFLERFLDRHGSGVHHLTFKVADLEHELERVAEHGLTPVSVDLRDPVWREAFLMPRDAHGTVVQLADSNLGVGKPLDELRAALDGGFVAAPQWWADPPAPAPPERRARLRRVVLRTSDVSGARDLFGGLLRGRVLDESGDDLVELEWDSGGRVRIEASPDDSFGIDRLELETPSPRPALELYGTPLVFV